MIDQTLPERRWYISQFTLEWMSGTPTIDRRQHFRESDRILLQEIARHTAPPERYFRVSGESLCPDCAKPWWRHRSHFPFYWDVVACNGDVLHL